MSDTSTNILHQVLNLPDSIQKSQFVVSLSQSVGKPDEVLNNYAVTKDISEAYDQALAMVKSALTEHRNEATYLHGSFGSGKSHFMAVLSLMLGNDEAPWSAPELHELRVKHDWLKSKKLLRLHFNMMNSESLESKVFGGYIKYITDHHPADDMPALFDDEIYFEDAERHRETMGDDLFFTKLNEGAPKAMGNWGKRSSAQAWDANRFAAAISSGNPTERSSLLTALSKTLIRSIGGNSSNYVGFGKGIAEISRHAKALGYDGIVLFLDELVLWLNSISGETATLKREVAKLGKLVEREDNSDSAAVMSFVARQRDLSELVGEDFIGASHAQLRAQLEHWEGRIGTITLGDKNLPEIVEKRVVRPRNAEAKKLLDAGFAKLATELKNSNAYSTVLGSDGDEAAFRRVYPFSPVLVETLISLSHLLQRERTALKVLMEILVEHVPQHLPDFQLGQMIPVGELWDVLAAGEDPLDQHMKHLFKRAKQVYNEELLPEIERESSGNPVADRRLIKTLILATMVSQVPAFKGLTVSRLVQLNHGSIKVAFAGTEVSQATASLRKWAARVHNLRIGEGQDPSIALVLDDVDTRSLIQSNMGWATQAAKKLMTQQVLFKALELEGDGMCTGHKVVWRGSRRQGSVVYGNVRDMPISELTCPTDEDFRIVVDYPFDSGEFAPSDDLAKIEAYREAGNNTATVVWLPSFFSEKIFSQLGELVVIERLLLPENKKKFDHLNPEVAIRTREALTAQREQKRNLVRHALGRAYGVGGAASSDDDIDAERALERHFFYLRADTKTAGATNFPTALETLVCVLMDSVYPRHPQFIPAHLALSTGKLDKCFSIFEAICESENQRLMRTKNDDELYGYLEVLGLVSLTPGHVNLTDVWRQKIHGALQVDGNGEPTVQQIRIKLDPEEVRGLRPEVSDFLVKCYALVEHFEICRPLNNLVLGDFKLGKLDDHMVLVKTPLPKETDWQSALSAAGELFGVAIGGKARTVRNLRKLMMALDKQLQKHKASESLDLYAAIKSWAAVFSAEGSRLATAKSAADLLANLESTDPVARVSVLASFKPPTSAAAITQHFTRASKVREKLADSLTLGQLKKLLANSTVQHSMLLEELRKTLSADELVIELAPALQKLALKVMEHGAPEPAPTSASPGPAASLVKQVIMTKGNLGDKMAELTKTIESALNDAGNDANVAVSWIIETKGR